MKSLQVKSAMKHLAVLCVFIPLLVLPPCVKCEEGTLVISDNGHAAYNTVHPQPGNFSDGQGHNDTGQHEGKHGHGGSLHVASINYHEVRDPLIFTIVVLLAGISKVGYHHANFLSSKVPESCILIVLGTLFGAIIHFSGISQDLPEFFRPHEFFVFLLPPIILEAAFSLHDRTFAENIGSILLFAVVGTVLACALLGTTLYGLARGGVMGDIPEMGFMEVMVFASLIVAVDPVAVLAVFNEIGVNHVLYFLVFGESLLNDGVTVVLYKVFQAYNVMDEITGLHVFLGIVKFFVVCLGGLLLGIVAGIATAVLTKYSTHVKVVQPIIIYTMAYLGFLLAEVFEFSGIISIIGCGLTQRQYAFANISDKSRTTIKYFTKVISSASEIIIFLFLGLSIVNDHHYWHTGFTLWTVFLCLVFRFIIIFGMTALINRMDIYRVRKISLHEQFMIAYGGLRGAVCFSLAALLDPNQLANKNMFVTTTLTVILFTVFVQGITIKPLVYFLQISLAPEKHRTMYKELNSHITDHLMAGIEDIIGDHGRNHLREKMDYLDTKYLKPLLQVEPDPKDSGLKIFYENLLLKEHYNYLKLSGAKTDEDIPELPHVNTELLLSSLAIGQPDSLRLRRQSAIRADTEPVSPPSAPMTPAITIDMDPNVMMRPRRSTSFSPAGSQVDVRGLRSLLMSNRNSRMVLSKYDRNLTSREEPHSELRKKSHMNKRLQRLFSQDSTSATDAQRRKSWSDADTQLCEQRGSEKRKAPPRHAMTVDLGDAGRHGTFEPFGSTSPPPNSPGSPLGSVFEDYEGEKEETDPMLDEEGKIRRESRKSSKNILKRQMGLDSPANSPAKDAQGALERQEEMDRQNIPLIDVTKSEKDSKAEKTDSKKGDGKGRKDDDNDTSRV